MTLSIATLCFLMLLLASCGQTSEGTASHSKGPTAVLHGSKSQITYVAIGASDTFGLGTQDPYTENWPTDLAGMIGPNVHLINLGVPGIRVHEALSLELPIAIDSHPDLVTIWLAVNDLADNVPVDSYSRDLDLMVSQLQASAPHALILVANIPDLTLLPYFASPDPIALQNRIQAYNTAIGSVVQRHHVALVNLSLQNYNLSEHPEYISSDGLHPTDLGYQKLAELFYTTLQKAQGSRKIT